MREIGVLEAKTHFSSLLEAVADGEDVVITRHGKPLVRLTAVVARHKAGPQTANALRSLRDEIAAKYGVNEDFDWKAAIETGRR